MNWRGHRLELHHLTVVDRSLVQPRFLRFGVRWPVRFHVSASTFHFIEYPKTRRSSLPIVLWYSIADIYYYTEHSNRSLVKQTNNQRMRLMSNVLPTDFARELFVIRVNLCRRRRLSPRIWCAVSVESHVGGQSYLVAECLGIITINRVRRFGLR